MLKAARSVRARRAGPSTRRAEQRRSDERARSAATMARISLRVKEGTQLHCGYGDRHLDPADLFADAERLARRLQMSRSQLYADALRENLARHDSDAVEALNQVCERADARPDEAQSAATRRLLERVEW
jgi:hypothetical protein